MGRATETYRLGGRSDLHGYLFRDTSHALDWASQRYVQDAGYRLYPVVVTRSTKKCRCCGTVKLRERVTRDTTREVIPIVSAVSRAISTKGETDGT